MGTELPWCSYRVKACLLSSKCFCFELSNDNKRFRLHYHQELPTGFLAKSRFTEVLPTLSPQTWGKLWHPYRTLAVVLFFFFACEVLVASSCTYGILQIPQLEKQVPFNAGSTLHVAKRLNEKHFLKPPRSHCKCAPPPMFVLAKGGNVLLLSDH